MSHGSSRAGTEHRPRIESCEPRILLASDVFPGDGAAPALTGQPDLTALSTADSLRQFLQTTDRDYIQETYGLTGDGQTVVVIDSGIAYDHPALGGGFGPDYRVVGGWDFAENDADPYDDAPGGFHGTHLAGIIGSTDATHGGLAPGVDLVALRVFSDAGTSSYDWIEEALQWVQAHGDDLEHPVTAVNISIGSSWNSDRVPRWAMLEDELRELEKLGIFVSVAAGNNFSRTAGTGLNYPAASPYVVPVGSVDAGGQISDFSQRTDRILTAPGESIISTVPDYLYGFDGVTDDFSSASGTSMATPYVTGASVLLRQALEITGIDDVNQDLLYAHLRDSADLIHDEITDSEYHRINLRKAVDTLMSDDYSSSRDTAYPLPTLDAEATVAGHLRSLTDVDYFTFVAGHTGGVRVDLQGPEHLGAEVFVVGANGQEEATDFVAVNSGETYVIGVRSSRGLGNYNLTLLAEQDNEMDVGVVDSWVTGFQTGRSGSGRIHFTAAHDGWMTITAPAGNQQARLSLVDETGEPLVTSHSGASSPTVSLRVHAAQDLELRVDTGETAELELRFTNLVHQTDTQIVVHGTDNDDVFVFQAGPTHLLVANGQTYRFDGSQRYDILFGGQEGQDRVIWYGSEAAETAILSDTSAAMRSTGYSLTATDFENVSLRGGTGEDLLVLHDSVGNDLVSVTDRVVTFGSEAMIARAFEFNTVEAHATAGEDRIVYRVGDAGHVRFTADSERASLATETGQYTADGFTVVTAYGGGEASYAELSDTSGNDRFVGRATESTFIAGDTRIVTRGFANVRVESEHGGEDLAILYDSEGNDQLRMSPSETTFFVGDLSYEVSHFTTVRVVSGLGGTDEATFVDGAGDDRLVSRGFSAYLKGDGYLNYATGFEQVRVIANAGGNDRALLLDLTSLETFFATDEVAGRVDSDNRLVELEGFASVAARNAIGHAPHHEIDAVDFVLVNEMLDN